jgi:hypothetical protein
MLSNRISTGLHDPAAVLLDGRVDDLVAEHTQPLERPDIIQPYQTTVADHIDVDDGDQLSSVFSRVRVVRQ